MIRIIGSAVPCPELPPGTMLRLLTGPPGADRGSLRPSTRWHLMRLAAALAGTAGDLHEGPGGPIGIGPWSALGMSVAYAGRFALVGVTCHGRIGVDLVDAVAPPEWREVAALYLGTVPPDSGAFVRAWAAHEAGLKCRGHRLTEHPRAPADHGLWTYAVGGPSGLVGAVCLCPDRMLSPPAIPRDGPTGRPDASAGAGHGPRAWAGGRG